MACEGETVEPAVHRGLDQGASDLHLVQKVLEPRAAVRAGQERDVGTPVERGMHGVGTVHRIVEDMGLGGAFEHVGRKAETGREISVTGLGVAVVPARDTGVERCLRAQREHPRAGGGDRIGASGVAGTAFAEKENAIEILEEAVMDQAVEGPPEGGIAEPGFAVREEGHQRPSVARGKRKAPGGRAGSPAGCVLRLEGDQERATRIDEDRVMRRAEPMEGAVTFADLVEGR